MLPLYAGLAVLLLRVADPTQAQPVPGPLAEANPARANQLRSRTILRPGASLAVEVTPEAEAAVSAIHLERRRFYARLGGREDRMDTAEASIRASPNNKDGLSSLFIGLNDRGWIVGILNETHDPYMPIKISAAYVAESKNVRVVFSGSQDGERAALVVSAYDTSGALVGRSSIRALSGWQANVQ